MEGMADSYFSRGLGRTAMALCGECSYTAQARQEKMCHHGDGPPGLARRPSHWDQNSLTP
jgi:hypothetical protein